jgi:hypothetical protein
MSRRAASEVSVTSGSELYLSAKSDFSDLQSCQHVVSINRSPLELVGLSTPVLSHFMTFTYIHICIYIYLLILPLSLSLSLSLYNSVIRFTGLQDAASHLLVMYLLLVELILKYTHFITICLKEVLCFYFVLHQIYLCKD